MLKLKIHIHEILNNNFRLEFPKLPAVVTVVVVSMFELIVVDFSETGVCGELCGASDVVIVLVVCSVVIGASHTIRKTCEWSLLLVPHKRLFRRNQPQSAQA
jgi:hypothetical protein